MTFSPKYATLLLVNTGEDFMTIFAKALMLGTVLFLCDFFIYGYDDFFGGKGKKKYTAKQAEVMKRRLRMIVPGSIFVQTFFALLLMFAFQTMVDANVFPRDITGSWGFSVIFLLPILYLLINMYLWYDDDLKLSLVPGINSWLSKFLLAFVFFGFFY